MADAIQPPGALKGGGGAPETAQNALLTVPSLVFLSALIHMLFFVIALPILWSMEVE